MLTFKSVYLHDGYKNLLYIILSERKEYENISHQEMPTWDQHCEFVDRVPYRHWYFVFDDLKFIGSCYVTRNNELGVWVDEDRREQGYAKKIITKLVEQLSPEPVYANVNPANQASIKLFESLGFKHIQNTYRL